MKLVKTLLALSLVSVTVVAYAGVAGQSSSNKVQVAALDANNTDSHGTNVSNVGIRVNAPNSSSTVVNKYVDLAGLKAKAESSFNRTFANIGGQDNAGIIQLDFNKWNLPKFIPDHKPLGKFSYKELPDNVYFGEWHQGSKTAAADKDRTVFYVGKNAQATPTQGTATYKVTGINQYNGSVNGLWQGWTGNATTSAPNNLLTGTLTADFGNKTLKGTLNRAVNGGANVTNNLTINGSIDVASGAVAGTARANNAVNGKVEGQFFGANAKSVAGIATFTNKKYDTAFGGSK